jgi:surfeit locus 1 family protein
VGDVPPEDEHDAAHGAAAAQHALTRRAHATVPPLTLGARAARAGWLLLAAAGIAGFVVLGTWQLHRRAWKLDLIERVQARLAAPTVPAPASSEWPRMSAARDEYRRVALEGTFLRDRETLVHATTALGMGYWVMTPLRRDDGSVVFVNRGFVPPEGRTRSGRDDGATGRVSITGLVRMSEPATLLRSNDAAADRWSTRDVERIGAARGLAEVAPYFVDAEASAASAGASAPVAGLTVVSFPNNHLAYALTWYGLAVLVCAATVVGFRARAEG